MNNEVTPAGLGSCEGLGLLPDVADAARVLAWARSKPRKRANLAFTAGAERQAAYWIEWAEAAERERCAKLCEQEHSEGGEHPEMALHCAERIRGLRA